MNPARPADVIGALRNATAAEVSAAITAAGDTGTSWRRVPISERAAVMLRASALLDVEADSLGAELTREEGKTLAEGVAEVRRAARVLRTIAGWADRADGLLYGSATPNERIAVTSSPVGVVGVVTPWNFPIAIPAWKLAPPLIFGNTVVWKPSEVTPLLAVRLTETLERAGLPAGALQLLLGDGSVGAAIVSSPGVAAVTFTGSTAAGRRVVAAAASRGARVQAEMGGCNAAVVLADADLDLAAREIVNGAMLSAGQKCTATSRVIAVEAIADELRARIAAFTRALVIGDPMLPSTDVGPVAQAEAIERVVTAARCAADAGASVVCGGTAISTPEEGWYVAPTVLTDVPLDVPLMNEEVFGPICAIVTATDTPSALAIARLSTLGLSGSLFTSNLGAALSAADDLDVGVVHINSATTGSEPHVPFGGVHGSGFGPPELGEASLQFFTRSHTVYIRS